MPDPIEETAEEVTEEVTDETSVDDSAGAADDKVDGEDQLADAGKKALDTMKAQRNAERDMRRALEAKIAELEKPKEGSTPDAEAIKAEARKEATAKANTRIIKSEAKAAAAGRLSPGAHDLLDLSKVEVDDDGNVDESDLEEAIAALLEKFPGLAAQGGKRFQGTGEGGPRNAERKSQLTEADLASMTPAQIDKARKDGRLDALMGK